MKKTLLIFSILLWFNATSQPVITHEPAGPINPLCIQFGIVQFGPSNFDFEANTVYIMVIWTSQQTATPSVTTQSWSDVVSTTDGTRNIYIKRYVPTSTSTEGVTIYFGLGGSQMAAYTIYKIKYAPFTNNGADAIVQTATGGATGADPSVTMSALKNGNGVIAVFLNNADPFGGSPESSWTEDVDESCTDLSSSGVYSMLRINGADNTPTVTASSSSWIGIAIEFRGGRRAQVTN